MLFHILSMLCYADDAAGALNITAYHFVTYLHSLSAYDVRPVKSVFFRLIAPMQFNHISLLDPFYDRNSSLIVSSCPFRSFHYQ